MYSKFVPFQVQKNRFILIVLLYGRYRGPALQPFNSRQSLAYVERFRQRFNDKARKGVCIIRDDIWVKIVLMHATNILSIKSNLWLQQKSFLRILQNLLKKLPIRNQHQFWQLLLSQCCKVQNKFSKIIIFTVRFI